MENPIKSIDFTELRNQKRTLLEAISETSDPKMQERLTGLLHLIDSIQDYAVDVLGKDEKDVFLFEENKCVECGFDMGEGYSNCGASEDGTCPECGTKNS